MSFSKFVTILLLCASSFAQISGPGSFTESVSPFSTDQAKNVPPSVNDVNFAHNMLSLPNPILVVFCVTNNWPGTKVLSVTANGVPMNAPGDLRGLGKSKPTDTSVWTLTGVTGQVNIHAHSASGATNGYGLECVATDMYGVDQADPITGIDPDNIAPDVRTLTCTVTPTIDNSALLMLVYWTGYNQSSPVSASPFPVDISSGRFSGEQIAIAHALNLSAGQQYSQTWVSHDSKTSVEWSAFAVLLRPAA